MGFSGALNISTSRTANRIQFTSSRRSSRCWRLPSSCNGIVCDSFSQSTLAALVSLLAAIYFLQVFNPTQGGLSVGFSGAMFVLIPLLWFYFAQVIKPEFLLTAFRVIVVLGLLTSLYGLYQLTFGFPAFEQYWIDNTDFYNSISVGKVERALATFSSAEEWGRYVEIGALIAFGFAAQAMNRMRRTGLSRLRRCPDPDAAVYRTADGHVWFDSRVSGAGAPGREAGAPQ